MRLVVLGGRTIALTGRAGTPLGDSGGELAMARSLEVVLCCDKMRFYDLVCAAEW